MKIARLYEVSLDALVNLPLEQIVPQQNTDGQYIFGVVRVDKDSKIKLPETALEVFHIAPGDGLLLVGDQNKGMALVKTDFI